MAEAPQQKQETFDNAKIYLWVKGLETKVNNLLREIDLLKNDFIKKNKELSKEMKLANEELIDFKHQENKMVEKMDLIIKELKRTAGIEELNTLKKYIDLWNPLNFVTERDVERIIEQKLKLVEYKHLKKTTNHKKDKEEKHSPFN